ncbi:MAG: hypothetical protein ACFFG0_01020 [Candidatus Thorarchaeota archaeon]
MRSILRIMIKKLRKKKDNKVEYKHIFSLREGEVININGIPCEYLGFGSFGSNTNPGMPRRIERSSK